MQKLSNLSYLLVTATYFASICTAIRVEWNTNTGPIIPPTPRTTVRPVPPFRDPAPVWEDVGNDIPNPNPYIYVPPPPSRPKQRLHTNVDYSRNANNGNQYGIIVTPQTANTFYRQNNVNSDNNNNNNSAQVSSLSPQYVPNVGTRYVAVVPNSIATKSSISANKYPQTPAANSLSLDDKTAYKLHGKYNAKTKKYKAYEKVKYVPLNYYPSFKSNDNTTVTQTEHLSDKQFQQLELPDKDLTRKWSSPFDSFNTTLSPVATYMPPKSYTKHVYAKDKTITKSKEKRSNLGNKIKKS